MSDQVTAAVPQTPAAADNVFSRLVGVVVSPRSTFQRIVARPRWVLALFLVAGGIALITFAFLSTEVGRTALLDQQVHQMEQWGRTVTEADYQGMERRLPMMRYVVAGSQLVVAPIMTLIIAAVLFGVFNAMLGGDATYGQTAAVLTYSGAISLLQQMFLAPLNYARASMSSATNLGVFVPFLDESNMVAQFLGAIDLRRVDLASQERPDGAAQEGHPRRVTGGQSSRVALE